MNVITNKTNHLFKNLTALIINNQNQPNEKHTESKPQPQTSIMTIVIVRRRPSEGDWEPKIKQKLEIIQLQVTADPAIKNKEQKTKKMK